MTVELALWIVLAVAVALGTICGAQLIVINRRSRRRMAARRASLRRRPAGRASGVGRGSADQSTAGGLAGPFVGVAIPQSRIELDYPAFFRRRFEDSPLDTHLPEPTHVLESGLVDGYGLSREEARVLARRLHVADGEGSAKLLEAWGTIRALADRSRVLERQSVCRAVSAELDRVLGEPRAIPTSQPDGYAAGREAVRSRLSALISASTDSARTSGRERWAAGDDEQARQLLGNLHLVDGTHQPVAGPGEDGPDTVERELQAVTAAWVAAGSARARRAVEGALVTYDAARASLEAAAHVDVATDGTREWRSEVAGELRQLVQVSAQAEIVDDYTAGFDRSWRGAEEGIRSRIARIESQMSLEERPAAPRRESRRDRRRRPR